MRSEAIDRRIGLLLAGFGLLFAALTVRLFYLQIIQHLHLSQLALRQQERTIEVQPARGRIFDREGRPLALNRQVVSFYAVPSEISNHRAAAQLLAPVVGLAAGTLVQRFQTQKAFVWVKRKVTDDAAKKIQALKIAGIHPLMETTRVYPEGRLASQVLGFVGLDNQGLSGLELQFDSAIRGQNGWIRINRDARGSFLPAETRINKESQPGQDLYLTLDNVVQHIAEKELAHCLAQQKAKAGSVVVMDPNTGEILALANLPDFDPNYYFQARMLQRRNRAIADLYEPGSTFKVITAAAALEENLFQETDVIDCENGQAVFDGMTVRDHEPQGRISFRDVIAYSSNIGAAKIGLRLGSEKFARYVQRFGIGKATGIDLPGEATAKLKPAGEWRCWNTVSSSFGQGVAATVLQMAMVYSVLANQGRLLKPWIVKDMRRPDEPGQAPGKLEPGEQVISSRTAERMRAILRTVVEKGTAMQADLPNYQVAGKTGTAQKSLAHGRGYDPRCHVASFIGFFPADHPKYLIAVVIDEPTAIQWGGWVAGPVFKNICQQLVAYLGIPPGTGKIYAVPAQPVPVGEPISVEAVSVPKVIGLGVEQAKAELRKTGLSAVCVGTGPQVAGQRPLAGCSTQADASVVLYLAETGTENSWEGNFSEVVVPQVLGKTMRDALRLLTAYGLKADISGSGIVTHQDPKPLAHVKLGERCLVQCQDPELVP